MRWQTWDYVIQFVNGETDTFNKVGGCIHPQSIEDGVLTLWVQDGELTERKHLGSFPLVNILRWKRT